jgi:hypothetical protein
VSGDVRVRQHRDVTGLTELLPDGHSWWRIARASWADPLDASHSARLGGRWNPPDSFPALYLNEDLVTARANMRLFTTAWPYEPEDLLDGAGPLLVEATLPRRQVVADAHTPAGIRALGLPATDPLIADGSSTSVPHVGCQQIGVTLHAAGLRGVRCRSAQTALGAGRELAWFPATSRSTATRRRTLAFTEWFWS